MAEKEICGIVMPISSIDGCSEAHWAEVLEILSDAVEKSGYDANLVSNADDVGVIHKRIIQNLYDNPIVVCDISGKNPNVMLELGMRLAFDKPTIIVKDEETSYSFDTSAIEHIEYPRDLRFSKIVEFKEKLSFKIKATVERYKQDPEHTTFLKHFGQFTVAKLDKKDVSGQEYIIEELKNLRSSMRRLEQSGTFKTRNDKYMLKDEGDIDLCVRHHSEEKINEMLTFALSHEGVETAKIMEVSPNHKHLVIDLKPGANAKELNNSLRKYRANTKSI